MAFDAVISLGGQSLIDAVWRLLQPALQQQLSNPIPISVPGLSNAWTRAVAIRPSTRSSLPGLFEVIVDLEAGGEALINANIRAEALRLTLGRGSLEIPATPVPLYLPTGRGNVRLPDFSGSLPAGGSLTLAPSEEGTITLPSGAGTANLPRLLGTINLPSGLGDVALPLPAVIPIAIELTGGRPISVRVFVAISAIDPIGPASDFGVMLTTDALVGDASALFPVTHIANAITTRLTAALNQLIPGVTIAQPPLDATGVARVLAASAWAVIADTLRVAFSALTGRTGRVIFPAPGPGASCDTRLLPTAANAELTFHTVSGLRLQIGFFRTAVATPPNPFPDFSPSGVADVQVDIGIAFIRDLLCCLIEKLPDFAFTAPAVPATDGRDVCCDWSRVTIQLGIVTLTGTLSLCIAGATGSPKKIVLSGTFAQRTPLTVITLTFTIPLLIDLNNVAAITGLRLMGRPAIRTSVDLTPEAWALIGSAAGNLFLMPAVAALVGGLPPLVLAFVDAQINGLTNMLLSRAHGLTSPVAIPPAIFEAFGNLVPATVTIDDLTVLGTLATPTAPWTLVPIAPRELRPPPLHPQQPQPQPKTAARRRTWRPVAKKRWRGGGGQPVP